MRERHFPTLRKLVIGAVGEDIWSQHVRNKDVLVALVVDCEKLVDDVLLPYSNDTMYEIETCARTLCHKLHQIRLKLHKEL